MVTAIGNTSNSYESIKAKKVQFKKCRNSCQIKLHPCEPPVTLTILSKSVAKNKNHEIGSITHLPLFRVRSWNNGKRCMPIFLWKAMYNIAYLYSRHLLLNLMTLDAYELIAYDRIPGRLEIFVLLIGCNSRDKLRCWFIQASYPSNPYNYIKTRMSDRYWYTKMATICIYIYIYKLGHELIERPSISICRWIIRNKAWAVNYC